MVSKSAEIQLNLTSPTGKPIDSLKISPACTVEELKEAILATRVALRPNRQRVTILNKKSPKEKSVVLEDKKTVSYYGLQDGDSIAIKDLGPQISWRGVFILEYLGPLIIHQILFFWRLNTGMNLSYTQILAYACITFHFLKREYESLFIHRFSNATMPVRNLFQNSFHYWIMSGFMIGYYLYSPIYTSPRPSVVIPSLLAFVAAELGNFYSHILLRNLRPEGSTARGIPRGFGFELVSCPNYTFEILAWMCLSVMTGLWSMWLFTIVGGAVMSSWALKKHRRYTREFSNYPKSRKAIIPFIL